MNTRFAGALALLVIGATATSIDAGATEVAAGGKLGQFTLADQYDDSHTVDSRVRLLVFTREKDVGKMVFNVLGQKPNTYLADHHAAFVMDISEMPRLITWAIAKPRMRRHPFRFLLDAEGEVSKAFPSKAGQATLLYLNDLTVQRVGFVSTPEQLTKELDRLAATK